MTIHTTYMLGMWKIYNVFYWWLFKNYMDVASEGGEWGFSVYKNFQKIVLQQFDADLISFKLLLVFFWGRNGGMYKHVPKHYWIATILAAAYVMLDTKPPLEVLAKVPTRVYACTSTYMAKPKVEEHWILRWWQCTLGLFTYARRHQ